MTSAHPPEDIRIFHKECTSLAAAGYDVYLVERGESYEKNGVHVVGVGEIPVSRRKRMTEGARKVYETALALDCDVYHLHDPELLPFGLRLKKKGKKVIFDSHENYSDQIRVKNYLPGLVAAGISQAYTRYESFALRRFDGLIHTCLRFDQDPYSGKCRNIAVIYNLPSMAEFYDRFDPDTEKIENSVCYVGSLTYERGITQLIDAAYKAGCKAYLAGSFASEEYKMSLSERESFQCVNYAGVLGREEVKEFIQKCRIGMATLLNVGQYNQDDSLPTKAYEYMALGMPVIMSQSPYNDRAIKKYGFGLCVDPSDPEKTAQAIRYLLSHPEEAKAMGENGRKAVREGLNWEKEQQKLFELYRKVLSA